MEHHALAVMTVTDGGAGTIFYFWIVEFHFIFLLIEFHWNFFISYKILPYYVFYYCILISRR